MNSEITRTRPFAASVALAAVALAAAACASEKPANDVARPAATQGAPGDATVGDATVGGAIVDGGGKPGAAVDVTYVQRGQANPGEIGLVVFTLRETYDSNTMSVRATGSDGLELIPADPRATMSMRDKADHLWEVSFRAAAAGVYYVDLSIEATDSDSARATRSYSARVVVGDAGAAAKSGAKTEMIDGEPVVILDAQETVID